MKVKRLINERRASVLMQHGQVGRSATAQPGLEAPALSSARESKQRSRASSKDHIDESDYDSEEDQVRTSRANRGRSRDNRATADLDTDSEEEEKEATSKPLFMFGKHDPFSQLKQSRIQNATNDGDDFNLEGDSFVEQIKEHMNRNGLKAK